MKKLYRISNNGKNGFYVQERGRFGVWNDIESFETIEKARKEKKKYESTSFN
jgi:hypothetical protein